MQQVNVGSGLLQGTFQGEGVPSTERVGVKSEGNFVKLIVFTALATDMKLQDKYLLLDNFQGVTWYKY